MTTRLLRDGLIEEAELTGTLLDIGAGIGALTLELLERGMERAVSVDASSAFVSAGREETLCRNRAGQVEWVHGDFVDLAQTLPEADVVTLDRVVCCYPRFEPLLAGAARSARRSLAISYPRDVWYVRAVMAFENLARRLRGREFRVVVHPAAEMEQLVRSQGFTLVRRRTTWVWSIDIYSRPPDER